MVEYENLREAGNSAKLEDGEIISCASLDHYLMFATKKEGWLQQKIDVHPIWWTEQTFRCGGLLKEILKDISISELSPGDIIINNDPYRMGSHLWDVMVFAPVFYEENPVAIVGNIAHHVDIGGTSGVTFEIFEEGMRIPPKRSFLV